MIDHNELLQEIPDHVTSEELIRVAARIRARANQILDAVGDLEAALPPWLLVEGRIADICADGSGAGAGSIGTGLARDFPEEQLRVADLLHELAKHKNN